MNFVDILNDSEDNTIMLGFKDNNILKINYLENPSIIITGETGSGKSILLDQIILQMINRYTSLDLELMCIDTSGVELNIYAESRYTRESAINDNDKSIVLISHLLKEIERRKELLNKSNCANICEYNKYAREKVPLLLVAIDEDKFLLRNSDIEKMLSGIITNIMGLNIVFILATSDVHNKFFERDDNMLASVLVSFDFTNEEESKKNNIEDSNNLSIGEFIIKSKLENGKYHNFEFDDSLIEKIVNR